MLNPALRARQSQADIDSGIQLLNLYAILDELRTQKTHYQDFLINGYLDLEVVQAGWGVILLDKPDPAMRMFLASVRVFQKSLREMLREDSTLFYPSDPEKVRFFPRFMTLVNEGGLYSVSAHILRDGTGRLAFVFACPDFKLMVRTEVHYEDAGVEIVDSAASERPATNSLFRHTGEQLTAVLSAAAPGGMLNVFVNDNYIYIRKLLKSDGLSVEWLQAFTTLRASLEKAIVAQGLELPYDERDAGYWDRFLDKLGRATQGFYTIETVPGDRIRSLTVGQNQVKLVIGGWVELQRTILDAISRFQATAPRRL